MAILTCVFLLGYFIKLKLLFSEEHFRCISVSFTYLLWTPSNTMRLVLCPQYYIAVRWQEGWNFCRPVNAKVTLTATLRTQILSSTFRHFHFSFAREKIPLVCHFFCRKCRITIIMPIHLLGVNVVVKNMKVGLCFCCVWELVIK